MCSIAASQPLTDNSNHTQEHKIKPTGPPDNAQIIQTPLPNPSLQVTADHNLKRVDAPVYAPQAGEVLLHIKATGICG